MNNRIPEKHLSLPQSSKPIEETLEDRLDRINVALQNTMQEIDDSSTHMRNYSLISYLHSYTNSYCNVDMLELDPKTSEKSEDDLQENIEELLISLDRAQMTIEDFWAENHQTTKKNQITDKDKYIQKLETENERLRKAGPKPVLTVQLPNRNPKLEQERKNFEEKLAELDFLVSTYKTKHTQITVLEENLRTKQSLLDQKEIQLRDTKLELDKSKKAWEENVVNNTVRPSFYENRKMTVELGVEEAPPPNLAMTPDKLSDMQVLQQSLRLHEIRYRSLTNPEEQAKLGKMIDQLKNKIATLRGQQALMNSRKSSKLMTDMKKTIEKEVNYEEYLRKSNLEKFSVKGINREKGIMSMTPSYSSITSKRFLFEDEDD